MDHGCTAEPGARPNDEERGHGLLSIGASVARSSSSVSFTFGDMHDMKLPRANRSLFWASLVDSIFIGVFVVMFCGLCGSWALQLPFRSDYRHATVAVVSLAAGCWAGRLWFTRHR